jgi:F0F1-type ATP synthase delta subunit
MKIARSKISNNIASVSLKGKATKSYIKEMAAFLLNERRVKDLDSIMRDVSRDWLNSGVVDVKVTSAFPLSSTAKTDVNKLVKDLYPESKKIIIDNQIDENLVGGLKIELPDQRLDVSIRSKLNKFKQLALSGKE